MGAPDRDGSGRRPMPGRAGATNPGLAPVAAECEQKNAPFASTSADVREQLHLGAVAKAVGLGWRRLRRSDATGSGGEVNGRDGERLGERRPTVDLAQGDLAGGEQRPEQHRRGLGRGQDRLGLDPPLELLVQALDRVRNWHNALGAAAAGGDRVILAYGATIRAAGRREREAWAGRSIR